MEHLELTEKKVLILSCGTGGGHNSSAKAIQEKLQDKNIKADFFEYLDIINPKIGKKVNKLYIKSTLGKGKIFKGVYNLGEMYQKTKLKSPVYVLNSLCKESLYKFILNNNYDYVVVTHLFPALALTEIKKEHNIKFIEIATDYVCIPFWEESNPDYIIIPHKDLERDFIEKGISKEKILPLGIPVFKQFTNTHSKEECKKALNLDVNKKYILMLNGSMGFGKVLQTVDKLIKEISDINLIVSCGTNKKLKNSLTRKYKNNDRVIALEYTTELYKYMASSDIVLTKPGGLTSTEVSTFRKPFIHTMPIPGCENYNADFFSSRQMCIKCNDIKETVKQTKMLLENKDLQEKMIEKQKEFIDVEACEKICNFIINELKGTK